MKQSVSLITLGVSDYDRAKSFYAALGWSPALEAEATVIQLRLVIGTSHALTAPRPLPGVEAAPARPAPRP